MPPRRSTRAATRSSVEPTPTQSSKRKRPSTTEPKPSTGRRSSARLSVEPEESKSRPVKTRGKKPLEKVPESDEEDEEEDEEEMEEELPKSKRSRPSLDAEEQMTDESEEDKPKPKRGKRASTLVKPASKVKRSSTNRRKVSGSARSASASLPKVEETIQEKNTSMDTDTEEAPAAIISAVPPKPTAIEEEEEESLLDPKPPTLSARRTLGSQKSFVQPNAPFEPKASTSRLVINKLALVNFKSYAGRQEIGPFHKSFSAIVGPNGSGKSNTIDALLFVFGYRASKMRQAKLSELIHHSAIHPDLDFCSVEVHFQDIIDKEGDEFEVVSGTKLVVTRTAYKNNSSKYTINGTVANYKEVQTLLKGRGIDLDHNRFLILQGEVESIAQMKPKAANEGESDGLLEYLEDIIGTSSLLPDINQAQEVLEALSEERQIKMNRVRHVEKEKAKLEKDKREAEDYLRLRNKHTEALNQLYQLRIYTTRQLDRGLEEKETAELSKLEDLRKENQDDLEHLNSLEKHFEERQAAYKQVAQAVEAARKDFAKQETRAVGIEERKKHEAAKNKKLKKALQEDQKAMDTAKRSFNDNEERESRGTDELNSLEEELVVEEKELARVRDSLKDKTQVFHDQIEAVQKQLQPCQEKINAKQAELDVANEEKQDKQNKVEEARARIAEAEGDLEQLQAKQEERTDAIQTLATEKANLKRQLEDGENTIKRIHQRVEELKTKASTSRQRIAEAKASQAQQTSQNRVVQTLTQCQRQGRIQGFHGRLGNLGTIPDEYDVAITTACSALNNMVVDTVEQAQACIEILRTSGAGRASFMVLDKLPKSGPSPLQAPHGSQRLFDLITPSNQKFAPAFFKAITNTLVTNDMDSANKIAYGASSPNGSRWRVVTTGGQLIDSSGTMSGGGNHVARGGMSAKLSKAAVAPEVMREWERDDNNVKEALDSALAELRDAEVALDRLKRSAPQLDMDAQKVRMELETGKKRIADAEKRLKELNSQKKSEKQDLSMIAELERLVDRLSADMTGLQKDATKYEAKIKKLEDEINAVGGSKLLMQKSKVDGIKTRIEISSGEITKAEVAKAKAEKDIAKFEKEVEVNTKKRISSDEALAQVVAELQEITQYIEELQRRVEDAQSIADTSKEDMDRLKDELDDKNAEVQAFRNRESEIKRKVEDMAKERKKCEQEIQGLQSQLEQLELVDIDDEDEDEERENSELPKRDSTVDTTTETIKSEPNENREKALVPKELKEYSEDELKKLKLRELVATTTLLNEKIQRANPDLAVLEEYAKREEEFLSRAADLEKTTAARDAEKAKYDALRKQRLDEFMTGFTTISLKLKEMYQMITLGGNAELELVDSMDPFSEGIIFSVMPPKKSWKNISNLSGGEKTLSSLALVFALHVYKPTPLYFMDEIDAALDFRNVSIVANYIKDRTKNAQFIIISLRNDMFELSHRLIGIYKTANATKSISVDNTTLMAEKFQSALSAARAVQMSA